MNSRKNYASVFKAQIICSGTGGWRYIDCVPLKGGKLRALEYVKEIYNISTNRCVAAGDSCNDILMLGGKIVDLFNFVC